MVPPRTRKPKPHRRLLTENQIKHVAALIKAWPQSAPPTWNDVVALVEQELRHRWTRQALQAHSAIKQAYDDQKVAHRAQRNTGKKPVVRPPHEIVLAQTIERLKKENAELRETLRHYDELLIRHVANAIRYGITHEQLEQPLIAPFRQQTDQRQNNQKRK